MSKTRIYIVATKFGDQDGSVTVQSFLVEAASRSQAERHVAAKFIKAEVAKPQDIVGFMTEGGKVETAKSDTETAGLPLGEPK